MPLFDMECPRCTKTWEALIVNETADNHALMCEDCSIMGTKLIGNNKPAFKIFGYSAKNGYGLKKFADPEKGWKT